MRTETSLASQRAIKAFARNEASVLLPAHDPDVAERLANRQVVFGTESGDVSQDARTALSVATSRSYS